MKETNPAPFPHMLVSERNLDVRCCTDFSLLMSKEQSYSQERLQMREIALGSETYM